MSIQTNPNPTSCEVDDRPKWHTHTHTEQPTHHLSRIFPKPTTLSLRTGTSCRWVWQLTPWGCGGSGGWRSPGCELSVPPCGTGHGPGWSSWGWWRSACCAHRSAGPSARGRCTQKTPAWLLAKLGSVWLLRGLPLLLRGFCSVLAAPGGCCWVSYGNHSREWWGNETIQISWWRRWVWVLKFIKPVHTGSPAQVRQRCCTAEKIEKEEDQACDAIR